MPTIKTRSKVKNVEFKSASNRIAMHFFELLETQYNCVTSKAIAMKFPGDFAAAMFVHINHLNKCLKEITGKTTSQLIAERKIQEAKKLLQHSALTIDSIRELLGFREVAHLNGFFRKHTGISPARFRRIVWNLQ